MEEAISHVSAVYAAHGLSLGRRANRIDMRLEACGLEQGASMVKLAYGADVDVDAADFPDLFLVMTCVNGNGSVTQADSRAAWRSGLTLPVSANISTRFHFDPHFEQISFRPDAAAISALCSNLLGRPLERPLRFELTPFSDDFSATWRHALQLLGSATDMPLPRTARQSLNQFLNSLLLHGHPHNFSAALSRPPQPLPRALVARAEEYIKAHSDQPLSVSDIASATGVSIRGLQAGFREAGTESPMKRLRQIRLEQAREQLLRAGGTVTDVALQFGFLHLGRFGAQYKTAFGELPAATLARARRVRIARDRA
ncbi:AraC family transcriptional regulator [Achromobacter sp.]|uniref:AraC family transcriptional regulator n=1 Tax=Achromobacter sp. TaxID=134375 RepID=UPI003C72CE26